MVMHDSCGKELSDIMFSMYKEASITNDYTGMDVRQKWEENKKRALDYTYCILLEKYWNGNTSIVKDLQSTFVSMLNRKHQNLSERITSSINGNLTKLIIPTVGASSLLLFAYVQWENIDQNNLQPVHALSIGLPGIFAAALTVYALKKCHNYFKSYNSYRNDLRLNKTDIEIIKRMPKEKFIESLDRAKSLAFPETA